MGAIWEEGGGGTLGLVFTVSLKHSVGGRPERDRQRRDGKYCVSYRILYWSFSITKKDNTVSVLPSWQLSGVGILANKAQGPRVIQIQYYSF